LEKEAISLIFSTLLPKAFLETITAIFVKFPFQSIYMTKKIRNFFALLLLLALLPSHRKMNTPSILPNIVLIFMDDMGYGDLSCYGALDLYTPQLDRLAQEGIRFTNFLSAQAVCSASRAALLTGCYPNRMGISGALWPSAPYALAREEMTMAELLKQKNYATGIFGKWHLGSTRDFLPLQQGFDEYLGLPYSNDMWPVHYDGTPSKPGSVKYPYPPLPLISGNQTIDTIKNLEQQGYLTEKLTDAAIRFIHKNSSKPFFAYIPYPMPHVPINASPAFKGKSKQGLYGDAIQEIDHHVGRILKTLEELNLDNNTLIIFTSDNGPWFNFGNHAGSTGGLREGKGTSFEGGQRVPCIIRWKSTIPGGLICNQLLSTIDLFPTIAQLTGTPLPSKKIDGVDMTPLLQGNMLAEPRKTFYYYYRKNSLEAVRRGNWKLVFEHESRSYLNQAPGFDGFPGLAPENIMMPQALYDLRRDPAEQYDVQSYYPDILKELQALGDSARADLGDDIKKVTGTNVRPAGKVMNP
jgi:arylsulfatase